MTLLLGDVAVFFYFTCIMYGTVRCHTLKDNQYMAHCQTKEDCDAGIRMICEDNKCICRPGELFFEWPKFGCFVKAPMFEKCEVSGQCMAMNPNSYCNPDNGRCTCFPNYFFNGHECSLRHYLKTPKEGPPTTDDLDSCPTVNSRHPVLLPHPDDCGKFYICDNGVRHLKECQAGLHFNKNIKACDYSNRAGCESGDQEKRKGKIVDDDLNPCPAENPEYPIMLPHSEDCSKFYVCDNGNLILRECSAGLHFNPTIKACDYPEFAGCETENLENQKGKMIGDDLNRCPSKNPSHPVMFPHPDDCNKYYVCDNGEALLRDCHPGLHYHAKIKACDYPKMAECDADFKKDTKLRSDLLYQDDICPMQMNGRPDFVPHSADCGNFFICNGGSRFLFTCPIGLHFNPTMNTCDFPESAKCDESANGVLTSSNDKSLENEIFYLCHENSQDFLFPHPIHCELYYFCDHGKAVLRKCPHGLNFNEELQVCDVTENKRCGKHMSTSIGVPSPFCPSRNGKTPIFYRHSTNCSVYYMCGNGLAYEFVCPARLHFNVRKKVCDYERNVGCREVNV